MSAAVPLPCLSAAQRSVRTAATITPATIVAGLAMLAICAVMLVTDGQPVAVVVAALGS